MLEDFQVFSRKLIENCKPITIITLLVQQYEISIQDNNDRVSINMNKQNPNHISFLYPIFIMKLNAIHIF